MASSNIVLVILLLSLSAMLGDSTGSFLGRRTGKAIFSRPDSRLSFKREHLLRTKAFYERYGGKTIVYARFVPIVRTFTAFVAGVFEMPYLRFLPFSVCGAFWLEWFSAPCWDTALATCPSSVTTSTK